MLKSLFRILIPRCCPICGEVISDNERLLCVECKWNMPRTNNWNDKENPFWQKLSGGIPINNAASFIYFRKGDGYDRLIHSFKYFEKRYICHELGTWFGDELKRSTFYDDVDLVIPIPLHYLRFIKRGYNQSEYFAQGIASQIGSKVNTGNVIRIVNNPSQTKNKGKKERYENVEDIFSVRNPSKLEGKHILIVDDVSTTGATVGSCAATVLNSVKNCRVSIAVFSSSAKDSFGRG